MKQLRSIILLPFISLLLIAGFSVTPAVADNTGDGSPPHSVRGVSCEYIEITRQYAVKAFPPNHVAAGWGAFDDVVYWKPILYKWNGSQYIKIRESQASPAYAFVTVYGFHQGVNAGWRSATGQGQMMFFTFDNLSAGTYAVLNMITWSRNGHVHMEWSPKSCAI